MRSQPDLFSNPAYLTLSYWVNHKLCKCTGFAGFKRMIAAVWSIGISLWWQPASQSVDYYITVHANKFNLLSSAERKQLLLLQILLSKRKVFAVCSLSGWLNMFGCKDLLLGCWLLGCGLDFLFNSKFLRALS